MLVAVPLAGISLAAGSALLSDCGGNPIWRASGWVLLALAAAAGLIAFDALLALLLPARPGPDAP